MHFLIILNYLIHAMAYHVGSLQAHRSRNRSCTTKTNGRHRNFIQQQNEINREK